MNNASYKISEEISWNEYVLSEASRKYHNFIGLTSVITLPVLGLILLCGLTGNVLVVVVSFKFKNMKTINNTMIVALAIADLCFLIFCVSDAIVSYSLKLYPFGKVWCKISQYIINVSVHVSICFICIVTMDRFLAIVFPLSSLRFRSRKHFLIGIAASTCFSLVINVQTLIAFDYVEYITLFKNERRSTCTAYFTDVTQAHIFVLTSLILTYCIPLIALAIMNGVMLYSLLRKRRISVGLYRNTRAAKIVLAVEIGFFVCWTPLNVLVAVKTFTKMMFSSVDKTITLQATHLVATMLAYSNSCLNPILYTFACKEYRDKLKTVLKLNQRPQTEQR